MPSLHSHTHLQAPQDDTQAKAYQSVRLSALKLKKSPFGYRNV